MKKSFPWILLIVCMALPAGTLAAHATPQILSGHLGGTDISGGGDGYAADFIEMAKDILRFSSGRSIVLGSSSINVADLERVILTTQVETTIESLRDSHGLERDAINIPAKKLIRVNRHRWSALASQQRQVLVVHEYFGILQLDDSAYRLSSPVIAAVQRPERPGSSNGQLINLRCGVKKMQGTEPEAQFSVSLFNISGLNYDYRGNRLGSYLIVDFYGAGAFVSKKIGYARGDRFGSWQFGSVYGEIGAEEMQSTAVRIGKIKTVIGVTGYPRKIRSTFTDTNFALKANDADNINRDKIGSKKLIAGFRGKYASGEQLNADLECEFVTDQGQILNDMFNSVGAVERMIAR